MSNVDEFGFDNNELDGFDGDVGDMKSFLENCDRSDWEESYNKSLINNPAYWVNRMTENLRVQPSKKKQGDVYINDPEQFNVVGTDGTGHFNPPAMTVNSCPFDFVAGNYAGGKTRRSEAVFQKITNQKVQLGFYAKDREDSKFKFSLTTQENLAQKTSITSECDAFRKCLPLFVESVMRSFVRDVPNYPALMEIKNQVNKEIEGMKQRVQDCKRRLLDLKEFGLEENLSNLDEVLNNPEFKIMPSYFEERDNFNSCKSQLQEMCRNREETIFQMFMEKKVDLDNIKPSDGRLFFNQQYSIWGTDDMSQEEAAVLAKSYDRYRLTPEEEDFVRQKEKDVESQVNGAKKVYLRPPTIFEHDPKTMKLRPAMRFVEHPDTGEIIPCTVEENARFKSTVRLVLYVIAQKENRIRLCFNRLVRGTILQNRHFERKHVETYEERCDSGIDIDGMSEEDAEALRAYYLGSSKPDDVPTLALPSPVKPLELVGENKSQLAIMNAIMMSSPSQASTSRASTSAVNCEEPKMNADSDTDETGKRKTKKAKKRLAEEMEKVQEINTPMGFASGQLMSDGDEDEDEDEEPFNPDLYVTDDEIRMEVPKKKSKKHRKRSGDDDYEDEDEEPFNPDLYVSEEEIQMEVPKKKSKKHKKRSHE